MSFLLQNYGVLSQQDGAAPLDPNLVSWYTFASNSFTDKTANGFDLALISGGTNDVASTNGNQTFRISGDTAFNIGTIGTLGGTGLTNQSAINYSGFTFADETSLMGWMQIDAFPNYQSPFGIISNQKMWRVYVTNDPTKLIVAQRFDGLSNNTVTSSITNPTVGTWYHVAMVVSFIGSQGNLRFFVNGVSQGNRTLSNNNQTSAAGTFKVVDGIYVGMPYKFKPTQTDGKVNDLFDGQIDDVRFYNRVLSDTEISDIYSAGRQ